MARPKDPEERRRLVQAVERKERTRRTLRNVGITLAVIVVIAAIGYGIYLLPSPPKQVHWHAAYEIYVNDQQSHIVGSNIFFETYTSQHQQDSLSAHIHEGCPTIIHNEGREGEGSMVRLFDVALGPSGGKLTDNELAIPQGMTPPGDYKTNGTESLRLFISANNGTWAQQPISYSIHDHDRDLLVYGNDTAQQITAFEDAFPPFETKLIC